MARIRHDLHEDVTGVVGGANEVMDWRAHLRAHPWLAGGIALAAGYWLVPRKARPTEVVRVETVAPAPSFFGGRPSSPVPEEPKKSRPVSPWRMMGWALNFAGPIALNAAQAYASVWLENQLGIRPKGPENSPNEGPRDKAGQASAKNGRSGSSATNPVFRP